MGDPRSQFIPLNSDVINKLMKDIMLIPKEGFDIENHPISRDSSKI